MKKMIKAFLLTSLFVLAACADGTKAAGVSVNNSQSVNDVIEDLAAKSDAENAAIEEPLKQSGEAASETDEQSGVKLMKSDRAVDIDLTQMNATMIYSEVFNMMMRPEDYMDKAVRIRGTYTHHYEESLDQHFYACIVRDAMACCAQGLEFVLNESYIWPDDYPCEGDEIVVSGVFRVIQETNFNVLQLQDAVIEEFIPSEEG